MKFIPIIKNNVWTVKRSKKIISKLHPTVISNGYRILLSSDALLETDDTWLVIYFVERAGFVTPDRNAVDDRILQLGWECCCSESRDFGNFVQDYERHGLGLRAMWVKQLTLL